MLLMIDSYDSFTYNLVQYFGELGEEVWVYRNDQIDPDQIAEYAPARIVLSPGPCTPNEAGVSLAAIERFAGQIPILGVCLGHRASAKLSADASSAPGTSLHGKTSEIHHRGRAYSPACPAFTVVRYHSLVIDKATAPDCLDITAWTQTPDGDIDEIMGVRHKTLPVEGVQFHPESILTEHGHTLLRNFLTRH
ncbi:MAG: aminodeoxychorismate/anthranilate synthase component II [Candidatus Competibacteraceae bacterium]